MWSVPAERMKGGREHRVPLTSAAIEVLERMRSQGGEFLFPGAKAGQGLSNMALLKALERMGRGDLTAHGFRATFKAWASERTNFPRARRGCSLTCWATRSRLLSGAATCSTSADGSWTRGPNFAPGRL